MDRTIVYTGAIPQDADILNTNRNMVRAIGHLARGIWGTNSVAAGLDATPASPLSLNFRIGPGIVTVLQSIDATSYGSLEADNNQTVKVGSIDSTTTFPVVAPTTAGRSVKYLVQAAFDQQDTDNKVLPYRNAANPAQPYAGPANSGTAQPTVRRETVALQAKRGTEATTGSEAVPAVSAGYVPLWIVTVAYGQTTVTAAHITSHPDAPWTSKLTDLFAKIDSPTFIGTPKAPTPTTADGIATKAYVDAILSGAGVSVAADPNTIAKRNGAGALVATSFIGKATSAGSADTATNATNATNAVNAQHAVEADNADNAVQAQNATTAGHATTAGSATTAASATQAANAAKLDNKNASVSTAADTVVVRDAGGFDRTTSWTAPSGVNSVMFNWIVAGGGGGGAGTEYGNGGGGGGGGSGGFGRYIEVPCKPGDKFVFTIGAGGIGAATPTVNGKPSNNLPVRDGSVGGQTTVTQNGAVIFTATGGEGGITSRNTNQAAQVSQGGTGGLPSGLTGQLGPGGTNDRASTFGGGGAPGPTQGSFGGAGGLAGGGGDRVTGASAGKAGVGHGSGGGGGGCKDRYDGGGYWFGGQGANGFVEITFPSQGAFGGTPAAINTTYNTTAPVTAGGSTGGGYTGGGRGNGLESFVVTMQSV